MDFEKTYSDLGEDFETPLTVPALLPYYTVEYLHVEHQGHCWSHLKIGLSS
jgi:hypothetical protein